MTRRFKADRILKRIHFNQKRRRRRRLTVEPCSSLRSAIIGTRTDLLTSHESTTPIPSKEQPSVNSCQPGRHWCAYSKKNVVFNLLLFNELKQTAELLACLIARTIPTSIDLIIGLPTIRMRDLVLKIPTHFSSNKSDGFADNFTSCVPAGINLFGTGSGSSGSENLCLTCILKLGRNLTR
jgi:hypothetical protein